ncbi:hypothetical protein QF046_001089 [Microbacterium sp. W4I4]|uniref:hypothetical protein n=1 Tax=Microbacterium sp. W4I4 TaxID=3042295 RepID=UPI00278266D4|nr:hypothetical protein [Microbacterium sp. W4I4]MDQ0613448.1 hypothetical protein [Microbacterium sp. W4I4]
MDLATWTCCTETQDPPLWVWFIVGGFVGIPVIIGLLRFIRARRRGTTQDPLPWLASEPVSAVVRAVHPAPMPVWNPRHTSLIGRIADWMRGLAPAAAHDAYVRSLIHDAWLIEVEYVHGERIAACLADVIPGSALDRFAIGTQIEVRCFEAPRTRLRAEQDPDAPATMRCLLSEPHTDVPRAGFDLDGVRARIERGRWSQVRTGSPFIGAMKFRTERSPFGGELRGARSSFPADPQSIWAGTLNPPRVSRRAERAPRPESAEEVGLWEDSHGFARTELIYAPIFWVCLPLAAIVFLGFEAVHDPTGEKWSKNFFGESADVWPTWFLWCVWIGAFIWLLIAVGVLLLRLSVRKDDLAEHVRIFQHGIPCTIHRAPHDRSGGDGDSSPTFIALDHRLDEHQAARIHEALRNWIAKVGDGWLDDIIPAERLFGPEARGGWYLPWIPGFGSAEDFAAHQWVLITAPKDPEDPAPTVTTIPQSDAFRRLRAKARRKAERGTRFEP